MKRTAFSVSLALPAAFLLGSFAGLPLPSWAGQNGAGSLAGSVAVVDLERVLGSYQKYRTALEAVRKDHEERQKELDAAENQVKSLNGEVAALTKGTADWVDMTAKLASADAAYKARSQAVDLWVNQRLAEVRQQAVDEVLAAVGDLAKRKGVQLVLRHRSAVDDPRLDDRQKLQLKMQLLDVLEELYHAPALDMTQDVIDLLKGSTPAETGGD